MVLGYHLTLCTYGFWLPNDRRGSYSTYVGSKLLLPYGTATKVSTRESLAYNKHDGVVRVTAKKALKYSPVILNGMQAREVGRAFSEYVNESGIVVWACCILPDHSHLVVARSRIDIEDIASHLKAVATSRLIDKRMHPLSRHTSRAGNIPCMWSRKEWKVFLSSVGDIRRCIRYVEDNPVKDRKKRQNWSFVTRFSGNA